MKKNDISMLKSVASALTALVGLGLMALAILRWREIGWGGLIWLAAFLAMFVIRTPFALRCRANTIARARKGRSEKILLAAMFGTMMVLPLLYLGAGVFTFADYPLEDAATLVGGLLQIPFLALFWLSHADLGRNWSPGLEVRESHELVTNGIYARIRNPMYASIWISALA
jgi:isoprenylcysteine carboxyl methyltransferase (ICMT) family protein YpbQ